MSFDNPDKEYKMADLELSGSKDMTVDGSSSKKIFKYTIPTDEKWRVQCVNIFLLDAGTMSHNHFAATGAALTTGLKLRIVRGVTDFIIKEIKDNVDLLKAFPKNTFNPSATGFLNTEDCYFGCRVFNHEMRLCDGDIIKMVVDDDLTGVDRLEASVTLWRYI